MANPRPHVIILNGVGSVGKSTAARALQAVSTQPLLHVSMDAFLDMLPEAMLGHPDGLLFDPMEDGGLPSVVIRTGPVLDRAMRGMRHAIAAMAGQGNPPPAIQPGPVRRQHPDSLTPDPVKNPHLQRVQ